MKLDLADYIQRSIYLHTFEPEETRLLRSYLKSGMLLVDVGANVGYYSLLAASLGCRVIAFEPSPYAFSRLETTILTNNLDWQIETLRMGLSDKSCELKLYLPLEGNHTPSMVAQPRRSIDVSVRRLDEVVKGQIDFLKIDVEGFEPNVIRGTDMSQVQALLCEFNNYWLEKNGTTSQGLYDEIVEHGFTPHKKFRPIDFQNILFTRK